MSDLFSVQPQTVVLDGPGVFRTAIHLRIDGDSNSIMEIALPSGARHWLKFTNGSLIEQTYHENRGVQ